MSFLLYYCPECGKLCSQKSVFPPHAKRSHPDKGFSRDDAVLFESVKKYYQAAKTMSSPSADTKHFLITVDQKLAEQKSETSKNTASIDFQTAPIPSSATQIAYWKELERKNAKLGNDYSSPSNNLNCYYKKK